MFSKRFFFAGLLLLTAISAFAQHPTTAYQSAENQYYWKNRPPVPGYWQQDVHYVIKAALDDKTDIITGQEELTYYNNSPDTLTFVYFHLYENAFQPGSYTADLHEANGYNIVWGKYEAQKKGTDVTTITVEGKTVRTETDNTIMKVWLPSPLLPGKNVQFNVSFSTYFDDGGSIRRRMKMYKTFGYKHYDGVHWYPRIDVYDKKFGWETDQHLTREFYGDFGTYDVELTLPNNYLVEATGTLLNESEMLPTELRQRLDIANFAKTPWNSPPAGEMIHADGTTKTWKYSGMNVHDFAFSADPLYRIGETDWNGIRIIAMCQEPHCSGWQNASAYTAKVIEFYSTHIGMYAYPKMVVCDAQDGMEYPMITLDGGRNPDYHTLLAHEVGHNWFFGMVGSNETYRALLDEGFTQFIDSWCCRELDGKYVPHWQYKSKYVQRFKDEDLVVNTEVYNRFMPQAAIGDETVIDTHSDQFNGALRHGGGYGQVYSKTATMLYNLQYVLGDSLFEAAFSHYFNQWKMCHPYVEDFRTSIIQYTHVDLNWFFDQWLTTAKTIDYGIRSVKEADSANTYLIKFRRYGRGQSPLDFTVISNDGSRHDFYIPNNWFVKQTNATVLPRWIGWDNIRPTYTARVVLEHGISDVQIDTTHRLADANMLNNSMSMPVDFKFDSRIYNYPSWEHYTMRARPDFWYNGYDGLKAGMYIGGDYLGQIHAFDLTFHYNTGLFQSQLPAGAEINKFDYLSVVFNYRTITNKFIKNSAVNVGARHIDGLDCVNAGFEVWDKKQKNRFFITYKIMQRSDSADLNYLLYHDEWNPGKINATFNFGYEHPYTYHRGTGNIQMNLRSSAIASDYDFHLINLNAVNKNDLGRININTRVFAQIGTGSNWAKESMLYAAGANPEEMMDNKYTRSIAAFPSDWATFGSDVNHFQYGGGLNLRGYSGYLMPAFDWYGNVRNTYKGSSGYAINTEIEFQELFRFVGRKMPRVNSVINLSTYLFGDLGGINFSVPGEQLAFGDFRADAGVGCALTIKRFPPLQMVKPLVLRFDMPLFLNSTPYNSPDYLQMRWVVGINRAF